MIKSSLLLNIWVLLQQNKKKTLIQVWNKIVQKKT